jgi:hypothetical protein
MMTLATAITAKGCVLTPSSLPRLGILNSMTTITRPPLPPGPKPAPIGTWQELAHHQLRLRRMAFLLGHETSYGTVAKDLGIAPRPSCARPPKPQPSAPTRTASPRASPTCLSPGHRATQADSFRRASPTDRARPLPRRGQRSDDCTRTTKWSTRGVRTHLSVHPLARDFGAGSGRRQAVRGRVSTRNADNQRGRYDERSCSKRIRAGGEIGCRDFLNRVSHVRIMPRALQKIPVRASSSNEGSCPSPAAHRR